MDIPQLRPCNVLHPQGFVQVFLQLRHIFRMSLRLLYPCLFQVRQVAGPLAPLGLYGFLEMRNFLLRLASRVEPRLKQLHIARLFSKSFHVGRGTPRIGGCAGGLPVLVVLRERVLLPRRGLADRICTTPVSVILLVRRSGPFAFFHVPSGDSVSVMSPQKG